MEFTYSLSEAQMKTGLRFYLFYRSLGLRVFYTLLVLLADGFFSWYCFTHERLWPLAGAVFLLLTALLLWLTPLLAGLQAKPLREETVNFLPGGIKYQRRAQLISFSEDVRFVLERKELLIFALHGSRVIIVPESALAEQVFAVKETLSHRCKCRFSK